MSYLSKIIWMPMTLVMVGFLTTACATPEGSSTSAASAVSTQTPVPAQTFRPSATPTATITPTPTSTVTSTSTPTATAMPTETPTFGPSPTPDFSKVVLLPDDLPPGFDDFSIEECFATDEQMAGDENASLRGQKESFFTNDFCFFEEQHFELIFGQTAFLPTAFERASFDVFLRHPETITETLEEEFIKNEKQMFAQKIVPVPPDIGETSLGIMVTFGIEEGISQQIDMIVFRRGEVGVEVHVAYIEDELPVIAIEEVARILDGKIVQQFGIHQPKNPKP